MNDYVIVRNNDEILIQHLTYLKFIQRINEVYGRNKHNLLVEVEKMIKSFDTTFENDWVIIYSFFLPEFYEIFLTLADYYNDEEYMEIASQLYERTWLSKNSDTKPKLDLKPLSQFSKQLKDFQLDFIKKYPDLKFTYDLDGYILSFEQGLGKTFTAIALAECLHKELVYIVCPNSIKETWANEIKDVYKEYSDKKLWHKEVFASGCPGYKFYADSTKFIIINQESIPNIYPCIDQKKNSMIIVDECQNFRGLETKRVSELLKLKNLSKSKDILMMSGTPIKALANEISPALMMIDPHFTREGAEKFNELFGDRKTDLAKIVSLRFKRVIYRKLKKDVLTLPEKTIENLYLDIPNADSFIMTSFREEITIDYHKEYLKKIKSGIFTNNKKLSYYRSSAKNYDFEKERADFTNVIYKYSNVSKIVTDDYINYIFQDNLPMHTLTKVRYSNIEDGYDVFIKRFMNKMEPQDKEVLNRFNGFQGWKFAAKSAYMSAFGKTYANMQKLCFMELWKYNSQEIIDRIKKNNKKTVIFTTIIDVADYITNEIRKTDVGVVEITGQTTRRQKEIERFKNDKKIQVMVATSQTLGTGVTLTEANQIFFFGTPWRDSDFQQAIDRVHRIGQDSTVKVFNIILRSSTQNITQRMQEVLSWSADMVNQVLTEDFEF